MSRRLKRTLSYLCIPLLFVLAGITIARFGVKPVYDLVNAKVRMTITNSAPAFMTGTTLKSWDGKKRADNLEIGEIQLPAYGTHYGEITCERIGLEAPLYFGDDTEILKKGAGQYIESALLGAGGTSLVGAHDVTYFAPLEEIKEGDTIQISTDYGNFRYQVVDIKIADATDFSAYPLESEKEQLILYTCYPFQRISSDREQRYFVYCDRVKE